MGSLRSEVKKRLIRVAATVAALVAAVAPSATAAAAPGALAQQRELANRYSPVVRLVVGREDCGSGLHYVPIDVNSLFGEQTVALRGPWGNDLVQIAPSARDLGRGLWGYHLDFPGNALQPGCDYLHWQQHLGAERHPTAYAHVVTDPRHAGKLALQYWFSRVRPLLLEVRAFRSVEERRAQLAPASLEGDPRIPRGAAAAALGMVTTAGRTSTVGPRVSSRRWSSQAARSCSCSARLSAPSSSS